jgi:hypothetical protein
VLLVQDFGMSRVLQQQEEGKVTFFIEVASLLSYFDHYEFFVEDQNKYWSHPMDGS